MEDGMGYRNFLRLTPVDYEGLLEMVGPVIGKRETRFRQSISASNHLAITLCFLASGDFFTSLQYNFKVSKQIISEYFMHPIECCEMSAGNSDSCLHCLTFCATLHPRVPPSLHHNKLLIFCVFIFISLIFCFSGSHLQPNGKQPLNPSPSNDALYIATIIGTSESVSKIKESGISLKFSESYTEGSKEICTAVCDKNMLMYLKSLSNDVNIAVMECEKNEKPLTGMGRMLQVSNITVADCVRLIKQHTGVSHVRLALAKDQTEDSSITTIALVPGSGGSLLKGIKADLFVTGEMFHHDVLDANHNGTSVILTNHSDSERGFLARMAILLNDVFKNIKIEISCSDADPLKTV